MLKLFDLNRQMKDRLKDLVARGENEISFRENPLLASFVACLGICQEVGTLNDELHRHIRIKNTDRQPSLKSMTGEIVSWKGRLGVRVHSSESRNLELDHPQLIHLLHPEFSRNGRGELHQLVFFPQTIAEIVSLQNIELVIVRDWAENTVFGGFSGHKNFYVTNDWEIKQNDGLRMARLIARRKLAFFGTHDLVAHVAGAEGLQWEGLQKLAEELIPVMAGGNQEAVTHLIAPYIIGVLLDDLAQPAHYGDSRRLRAIRSLGRLQNWVNEKVPAQRNFRRFPSAFSRIIEESRHDGFSMNRLTEGLRQLGLEIQVFGSEEPA